MSASWETPSPWFLMMYRADAKAVSELLRGLVAAKEYPDPLWNCPTRNLRRNHLRSAHRARGLSSESSLGYRLRSLSRRVASHASFPNVPATSPAGPQCRVSAFVPRSQPRRDSGCGSGTSGRWCWGSRGRLRARRDVDGGTRGGDARSIFGHRRPSKRQHRPPSRRWTARRTAAGMCREDGSGRLRARFFRGERVRPNRRDSSCSSVSVTAFSMIAARSPSGTSERRSAR